MRLPWVARGGLRALSGVGDSQRDFPAKLFSKEKCEVSNLGAGSSGEEITCVLKEPVHVCWQ